MASADRSRSRGREQVFSSGRGGAGNIRPASKDPVVRGKGPDDFSPSRGRELPVIGDNFTHSGKGGAGNIRSPSRDADGQRKAAKEVDEYAKAHHDANAPITTGKGGYGNVLDRSRSRSKGPTSTSNNTTSNTPRTSTQSQVHTYGHGGAGNVAPGVGAHNEGHLKSLEEEESKNAHAQHAHDHVHSGGRGGAGNIVQGDAPGRKAENEELHAHHHGEEHASSGRGGSGNIH